MIALFNRFERFLRIDPLGTKSTLMRARAVYMMGLAFLATQIINLISMYYSYGGFTFDHLVSVIACVLVIATMLLLRRTKRFVVFAWIYSILIIAGTLSSALNLNTGINSALIPFFILGAVVNGFICGWRATMAFGAFAIVCVWYLWWVSSNYAYTPLFDVDNFAARNFQRAMQASLATILITMVGAFFSKNMHEAFSDLEAGIRAAQASDRAKTDFLATMSHELCTPMNGIIGMNEVLEETDLDQDQRDITAVIRESGRDLQTIIGNVILFSQLDGDRVSLDSSPFDLQATLKDVIKPYVSLAQNKGLVFKARMAPSVPKFVIGDDARTAQIITALLDNAVKFTDEGAVELSVKGQVNEQGLTQLTFAVTDTGIGIPPEDTSRIFERFTQQDGSINRRHGGTGLGLTIARELTELMGGNLIVQSEVNVGTSFTIRLPYGTAEARSVPLQDAAE